MKKRLPVALLFLSILLILSLAQVGAQHDLNAIRFAFENALHLLQGEVMTGGVTAQMTGPELVERGLANHAQDRENLQDYFLSGRIMHVNGRDRFVLLLCDKHQRSALLEGILCQSRTAVIEPSRDWQHPCDFSMDVARECAQ